MEKAALCHTETNLSQELPATGCWKFYGFEKLLKPEVSTFSLL